MCFLFYSVSPGFDGIREQNICNSIMAKLIQKYSAIFESVVERRQIEKGPLNILMVKVSVDITHFFLSFLFFFLFCFSFSTCSTWTSNKS